MGTSPPNKCSRFFFSALLSPDKRCNWYFCDFKWAMTFSSSWRYWFPNSNLPIHLSLIETNEWGEYFPYWTSSYTYNKSDAQSRYPLTYEQAIARWYNRDDTTIHINIPEDAVTINAQDIVVDPKQCNDDIVEKVLICKKSGKPYRIIKPELELYRKTNMILPQLHQDIRHQERMSRRLGRRLSLRTCPISGESLITPYDASFNGQVLNKKSYEQKIYS